MLLEVLADGMEPNLGPLEKEIGRIQGGSPQHLAPQGSFRWRRGALGSLFDPREVCYAVF